MPIYEYRCNSCEHEMEALRKMSDPPLTHCPACETEDLVKKISAAAFRLKGAGWYETDFKKEGQRNLAGDKDSSKTKSAGSAKKPSDSAKSSAAPAKAASKSDSAA